MNDDEKLRLARRAAWKYRIMCEMQPNVMQPVRRGEFDDLVKAFGFDNPKRTFCREPNDGT